MRLPSCTHGEPGKLKLLNIDLLFNIVLNVLEQGAQQWPLVIILLPSQIAIKRFLLLRIIL